MGYFEIYKDKMQEAGINGSDKGRKLFEDNYTGSKKDNSVVSIAEGRGLRLNPICAAIAHLKTSKYLGLDGKEAYDIRNAWGLTDEEYKAVAEKFSYQLEDYHLEDAGVVSQKEIDRELFNMELKGKRKKLLAIGIVNASVILILALVFVVSSVYCNRNDDYETVEVKLESIGTRFNPSTKDISFYCDVENAEEGRSFSNETEVGGLSDNEIEKLEIYTISHESFTAYEYNNRLYLTEDSMRRDRTRDRIRAKSLRWMVIILIYSIIIIPVLGLKMGAWKKYR